MAFFPTHEGEQDLSGVPVSVQDIVSGQGDGHFHAHLSRQLPGGVHGVLALDHGPDLPDRLLARGALTN